MVKSVIIARKNDGMIFCEVAEDSDKNLMVIRNRAIDFLKNMNSKQDLGTVNIDSQNFVYHYKINQNIVYLVITDIKYPSKLSFCFLDEVNENFMEELKNHFGTQSVNYYSVLETIDRPFYFIKFEKFIKKKKQDYIDTGSRSNIERLNREISDIHKIMTDNISLLFDREKNLDSVINFSGKIVQESEQFKKRAKEVRLKMLLSKYYLLIAIFAIILLFIVFKYYL